MTKNLSLSVSPTEALNVLNGKQTALLRKRVPKGYVGWCYGVVSKGKPYLNKEDVGNKYFLVNGVKYMGYEVLNSKIPFRFWYEEVETYYLERPLNLEITYRGIDNQQGCEYSKDIKKELLKKTNLTFSELFDLGHKRFDGQQSVINLISITKLEVFDKPMELGNFNRMYISRTMDNVKTGLMLTLTKSPSTYQYVWVKE